MNLQDLYNYRSREFSLEKEASKSDIAAKLLRRKNMIKKLSDNSKRKGTYSDFKKDIYHTADDATLQDKMLRKGLMKGTTEKYQGPKGGFGSGGSAGAGKIKKVDTGMGKLSSVNPFLEGFLAVLLGE